jgi:hypothetical protein
VRVARIVLALLLTLAALALWQGRSAYADFHCMRIHAVKGGFNGNNNVQYVELRMSLVAQNLVGGHKVRFYDSANVLKATFTFPGNIMANAQNGESILLGTAEFNAYTLGGDADFTFSAANTVASNGGDLLHPVQGPGGKVVFAGEPGDFDCNFNPPPVDSVGYGSYSGPIDFGSSPAPALPVISDNRALRLSALPLKPSDNAAEYSLQAVSASTFSVPMANLKTDLATPRNNARSVLQLQSPVGGQAAPPGGARPLGSGSGVAEEGWLIAGAASSLIAIGGAVWYARRRRWHG